MTSRYSSTECPCPCPPSARSLPDGLEPTPWTCRAGRRPGQLRSTGAPRVRLSARLHPVARAAVHLRGPRGRRRRARSSSVRLGRSTTRGVVADVGVEAPPGIEPVPVGRLLDEVPAPLVDLALWVADYYGSTPARALELVAPAAPRAARRAAVARRARVARGRARAGGADRRAAGRGRADRRGARRGRRRARPARGADRQRQDRGVPPGLRRGARARARDDRARPGDRARAADGRALPARGSATASRSSTRRSATRSGATSATGSRGARRGSSSARGRPCSRRCAASG